MRLASCGSMPMPLSPTQKRHIRPSRSAPIRTSRSGRSLNFAALPIRFRNTRLSPGRIGAHHGQRADDHVGADLLERAGEGVERALHEIARLDGLEEHLATAGARVLEQVADQRARLLGGVADPVHERHGRR